MMEYLKHVVSKEQLSVIFKCSIDRSLFISGYPHFGTDGNNDFYVDFIDTNISKSKFKVQEDSIELSIVTNTFKPRYLDTIRQIIYSRRNEWIKLLCMDWLFVFFSFIPPEVFIEVNEYALKNNKYELVRIQSLLNSYLQNKNIDLIKRLMLDIKDSKHPTAFYRFVNGLNCIDKENLKMLKVDVLDVIKKNSALSASQKTELVTRLQ